jgi:osmotically-inducible protein OsmY
MKFTAVLALASISGCAAYSTPSRGSLRQLGTKSVTSACKPRTVGSSMTMEGQYCSIASRVVKKENVCRTVHEVIVVDWEKKIVRLKQSFRRSSIA